MDHRGMHSQFTTSALLDAVAVPVIMLSQDRVVVAANKQAHLILQANCSDAVVGQHLTVFLDDTHAKDAMANLARIEQQSALLNYALIHFAHEPGTHVFSAKAIHDDAGILQGFLCQCAAALQPSDDMQLWQSASDTLPHRVWEIDWTSGKISPQGNASRDLPEMPKGHIGSYRRFVHPDDCERFQFFLAGLFSSFDDQQISVYRTRNGRDPYALCVGVGKVVDRTTNGFSRKMSITEFDIRGLAETPADMMAQTEKMQRWQTAVLSANQAVWDHDFEYDRHYLSQTWRDLRGLSETDTLPQTTKDWLVTIHEQDVGHIQEELRRIDTGETDTINYKFRQKHKNGHWVWFLSRGRVVRRDGSGAPVRIIGTDTDITEIKNAELESQRMAQRLDVAMEAAGMARWEFDINAKEAYWDDRLLKMFALTDGKNIRPADDWAQFIHPEDRDTATSYTEACLIDKKDVAHDYRAVTRDGTTKHIRTLGKYVDDAETGPRYYGVNFDITRDTLRTEELEKARALLEYESRHDALTGLANRRRMDEAYSDYLKQYENSTVAALHFDIDRFKQINDTLGHDAGDATLKHAAQVLLNSMPENTLVSRVGGDEFVALLFDAPNKAELEDIANTIIQEMSLPFFYASQECNIGTSIGVAIATGSPAKDSSLFIDADLALYEAKKAGRGRYRFFDSSMKDEARKRKKSFDALSAGFEKGEITCHYQPQFDAQTLEITGLEALVRWDSAKHGLIMPQDFLQTAEDMGLLAQFDELVLRRALYDMKTWQSAGLVVPPISVNVSAHRLNDPSLGDQLRVLNLPAGMLSFELLESAFLDARNDVIDKNLKIINGMGIDVEIDDFGSGHASIASLLQISPKRLKIDRFLIEPIVRSLRQRELVKTIIGIGHMLGIQVVAEGVETKEHIAILQKMGCCYLQGYGLSRPMEPKDTAAFINAAGATQTKRA
ncbi:MAG: putative bifunctional diguanylate cyclase/phosphodiesterase [Roseobacter sp.]